MNKPTTDYSNADNFYYPDFPGKTFCVDIDFKWGGPEKKTAEHEFSPGAGHTIDSNQKFSYCQRFDVNGEDFTFTTIISQGSNQIVKTMNPNDQMNNMLTEIQKGMAFVTGYWFAEDMNWMDGDECGSGR